MRYSWQTQVALVVFALAPFFSMHVHAQSKAEDLLKAQQNWHIDCMPKGCIASVDILRGESGEPPDSKDPTQYVSVAVGTDRKSQKPNVVIFEVDPHADKQAGIDLLFAHSIPDGKGWKVVPDPEGPRHLPIVRCNETECAALIGGGTPDEATLKSCADLVAKMRSENHLFLSYVRNGHNYHTAVSLTLFKEAYKNLISRTSAPIEAPAKP